MYVEVTKGNDSSIMKENKKWVIPYLAVMLINSWYKLATRKLIPSSVSHLKDKKFHENFLYLAKMFFSVSKLLFAYHKRAAE